MSEKSSTSASPSAVSPKGFNNKLQYLDLVDLDCSVPGSARPGTPTHKGHLEPPQSPTQYKEIDFVKTEALTRTKEDIEQKTRKDFEKSNNDTLELKNIRKADVDQKARKDLEKSDTLESRNVKKAK